MAIEVPNRVLVWEDRDGVWVTRDTSRFYRRQILGRHEANKGNEVALKMYEYKVAAMIDNVTR